DSFLDVVANVVGIIIRLILVVWVGARTYTGTPIIPTSTTLQTEIETTTANDPLISEMEQRRRELAQAQNRLLEQLRQWEDAHGKDQVPAREWSALEARRQALDKEQAALDQNAAQRSRAAQAAALSGEELRQRSRRLTDEIKSMEKLPPLKKTFRYK